MKKGNGNILYGILFGILMLFLFSFMIQEHFKPFEFKKMNGRFAVVNKPDLTFNGYKDGTYQKGTEKYLQTHFGFYEPIVRGYNQYCWDFYRKSMVSYIKCGKDNWLFYNHTIENHYGTEMYNWYKDVDAAREGYEREIRLLNKVDGILRQYGVTLMTVIAPSKGTIYSELLPRGDYDTTTLKAADYFTKRFDELHLPYLDMTEVFFQMKDTCSFYLFQPLGHHWNFSCIYAADTLFHFMEHQRGIKMPQIQYGDKWLNSCSIGDDRFTDHQSELNLMRPIKYKPKYDYREREYWLTSDSTTTKPAVLITGNSFYLWMMYYIPPKECFSDFQYWYYNKVAYQGVDKLIDSVAKLDRLDYLLDADYVVWFTSESQMYHNTEGFAADALLQLCIGEDRFNTRYNEVKDSLYHDNMTRWRIAGNCDDELFKKLLVKYTKRMIYGDPENFFPELAGEGIPTARNPRLLEESYWKKRDIRRQIKRDTIWMTNVSNFMVAQDVSMQEAINEETDNVFFGRPLMRDTKVGKKEYREILIKQTEQIIWNYKEWLESVKADAEKRGITIEEAVTLHATYTVDQKIRDGKVILPE